MKNEAMHGQDYLCVTLMGWLKCKGPGQGKTRQEGGTQGPSSRGHNRV